MRYCVSDVQAQSVAVIVSAYGLAFDLRFDSCFYFCSCLDFSACDGEVGQGFDSAGGHHEWYGP